MGFWNNFSLKPETDYLSDVSIDSPKGLFGAVDTVSRTPIIELKANYGLTNLRDVVIESGSATVTNNFTEYTLATSGSSNSIARLESAERGRYMPGGEGEAGIGIRIDETLTGDEDAKWGYFDQNNGFGFGVNATGSYVFVRKAGNTTKYYQSDWKGDKLDGTGDSGLTLDLKKGQIFQINYAWYGYGPAEFSIHVKDRYNIQREIIAHRFAPSEETSIDNPNLPINAEITNGSGTNNIAMHIGGRQYSVYTPFNPNKRINSERVIDVSVGTTFIPLITYRRKADYLSAAAKIAGLDLITDVNLIYQFRLNGSLTGASYGTPSDTTATETAMESDTSATAITGGELLYQGLAGTSGVGSNAIGQANVDNILTEIPGRQPISLCARTTSGTATVTAVSRWTEEW